MFSLPIKGEDMVEVAKNQNKAFLKLNYFIKTILDFSVVYSIDDYDTMRPLIGVYKNNFLTVPDFSEATILELIHAKLSVLCGVSTFIDHMSLKDIDTQIGYDLIPDVSNEYNLPDIEDWNGDLSFHTVPWWMRYDSSTFDGEAKDKKEQVEFRNKMVPDGELNTIDGEIDLLFDEDASSVAVQKAGEIIDLAAVKKAKKDKWEPKIV